MSGKLTQEDHDRLIEFSGAFYLGPESEPSRKGRGKRVGNRSKKIRRYYQRPTERGALRFVSEKGRSRYV